MTDWKSLLDPLPHDRRYDMIVDMTATAPHWSKIGPSPWLVRGKAVRKRGEVYESCASLYYQCIFSMETNVYDAIPNQ